MHRAGQPALELQDGAVLPRLGEYPWFRAPSQGSTEARGHRRARLPHWRRDVGHVSTWPAPSARKTSLYLQPNGKLGFSPPGSNGAFDQYVSDSRQAGAGRGPHRSQRHAARLHHGRPAIRIAPSRRARLSDGGPREDVTLSGPVNPVLHVSTTESDADFIVKLIDVFPGNAPN